MLIKCLVYLNVLQNDNNDLTRRQFLIFFSFFLYEKYVFISPGADMEI